MSKIKLKNWVAFAEIISAIAVVISLIYVGMEIRRSTLESDADIQAELLSYTIQRRYILLENKELSVLLVKGYEAPSQLTPAERLRFQSYIEIIYVAWERAYMTKRAGVFSAELFEEWNGWFVSVAKNDPEFIWPLVRDSQGWHPDFIEHVNNALGYPLPISEKSEVIK